MHAAIRIDRLGKRYPVGVRRERYLALRDVVTDALCKPARVLRALLRSLSTSTVRARLWHGIADRGALDLARDEHRRIYDAIVAGDADLARAATLLHIVTNETWLREHLGPADDVPLAGD